MRNRISRSYSPQLVLAFFACCLFAASGRSEAPAPLTWDQTAVRIKSGIGRLNELYWSPTLNIWLDRPGDDLRANYDGRRNPPWWPSANAVEMLIDFMGASGGSDYQASIGTLYDLQKDRLALRKRVVAELKHRNQWSEADEKAWQHALQNAPNAQPAKYYTDFQNEYLDDSGWWAITWLKMYDRTKGARYLSTAMSIHAHMAKNWNPAKGGGVLWCEDADKQRPNTITNCLFLILSARLYQATHEQAYLTWAEKTLGWLHASSLYDGTAVVDGPGHRGDYWSYNQGAFIGGLTALYQATGKQEYLDEAVKAADSILHRSGLVLPTGVIVEKLGSSGDACLFKGVFVRYLGQLRDVLRARKLHPETAQEIDRCIRASAESLLQNSIGTDGLFTAEWHDGAKDHRSNFNTQVSALAALVAMKGVAGESARLPQ